MDAVTPPALDVATEPRRGGFWRRWLATLIDAVIVMLPFQALAAILFSLTAGMIQLDNGLFRTCTVSREIPAALDPPPPHDSNFSNVCHFWFFTMKNGAVMIVGRTTRDGAVTTTVTEGYMLDANDKPIKGYNIDWIVWLSLVAYLALMIWKSGRSLGGRVVNLRVIDTTDPGAINVPLRKAFLRYLAMAIGFVPVFALLLFRRLTVGDNPDELFTTGFFQWFLGAGLIAMVWTIVLIVQVARKRDPWYDRLAGTAVIRT
jgi:uncharacterized RDD family membrane protein YckC